MTLTGFDFVIMFLVCAASIFSMFKGFVVEFSSTMSLLIGGMLSYSVGKDLSPYVINWIPVASIAYILSYGVVFLFSLLGSFILLNMILGSLKINSRLNQLLGFAFGITKSMIIASLLLLVIDFAIPYKHQPKAIQDSLFKHIILKKFIL